MLAVIGNRPHASSEVGSDAGDDAHLMVLGVTATLGTELELEELLQPGFGCFSHSGSFELGFDINMFMSLQCLASLAHMGERSDPMGPLSFSPGSPIAY
jgi:hypothetical protein